MTSDITKLSNRGSPVSEKGMQSSFRGTEPDGEGDSAFHSRTENESPRGSVRRLQVGLAAELGLHQPR